MVTSFVQAASDEMNGCCHVKLLCEGMTIDVSVSGFKGKDHGTLGRTAETARIGVENALPAIDQ
jgi:hypothetical protein